MKKFLIITNIITLIALSTAIYFLFEKKLSNKQPIYLKCDTTATAIGHIPSKNVKTFKIRPNDNTVLDNWEDEGVLVSFTNGNIYLKFEKEIADDLTLNASYSINRISGEITGKQFGFNPKTEKIVGRYETVEGFCEKISKPKI